VLTALHGWTDVAAVASTTTLTASGRTVTAHVEAADAGQVAGTVTFAGAGWSASATLSDGAASIEVPAQVGAVTATYDGYSDGRVSVSASPTVTLGVAFAMTTAAKCLAGKVVQSVAVTNTDPATITATIVGAYGNKVLTLAAGTSASAAFTTRLTATPAQTVTVTARAADGRTTTQSALVPSTTCR